MPWSRLGLLWGAGRRRRWRSFRRKCSSRQLTCSSVCKSFRLRWELGPDMLCYPLLCCALLLMFTWVPCLELSLTKDAAAFLLCCDVLKLCWAGGGGGGGAGLCCAQLCYAVSRCAMLSCAVQTHCSVGSKQSNDLCNDGLAEFDTAC